MTLYPLFPITNQFQDKNGMNLVAGIIRVFYAGRTEVQPFTYKDSNGETKNPQDIILDNNGRAVVYVNPAYAYNMFVYDSNENLLWSQYNIYPENVAEVNVDGMLWVEHDETLKGSGTADDPLSVVSAPGPSHQYKPGDNIEITDDDTINVIDRKTLKVQSPITKNISESDVVLGFDDSAYATKTEMNSYETKANANSMYNGLKSGIDANTQDLARIHESLSDKASVDYVDGKTDILSERVGDVEDKFDHYYDKDQVDGFLKNWSGFVVVPFGQSLPPVSEAQLGKIYLWQESTSKSDNYSEWICDGSAWSKIGEMSVDLSNYYTKTEVDGQFTNSSVFRSSMIEVHSSIDQKLSKVEVDGQTVIGDGTSSNPLKAMASEPEAFTVEGVDGITITDDVENNKTKISGLSLGNAINNIGSMATKNASNITALFADLGQLVAKVNGLTPIYMATYTGSSSTNTKFNAIKNAWDSGKMVFVKYTVLGGDVVLALDQIDSSKAVFTRCVGTESTIGASAGISMIIVRSDDSYQFVTTNL